MPKTWRIIPNQKALVVSGGEDKVCDVPAVRVIAIVAVCLGIAAPAYAEVDAAKIEKARNGTLNSAFQDDLPGYEVVPVDNIEGGGEGGGLQRGGPSKQGSGSGGTAKAGGDPRKNGPQSRRDQAGRVNTDRVDTREQPREPDGPMGGIMTMFMWGLVAVAAALLIFWFISEFTKGDPDVAAPAADDADAAVKAATAAVIDRPLGDADDLAARGEYAEAIHTLLLRTMHELARSSQVRVERSHTSREILRRVALAPDARDALGVLITYVELTHFGDEPAGANDYQRCREQFHVFANAFKAGLALAAPTHPSRLGAREFRESEQPERAS